MPPDRSFESGYLCMMASVEEGNFSTGSVCPGCRHWSRACANHGTLVNKKVAYDIYGFKGFVLVRTVEKILSSTLFKGRERRSYCHCDRICHHPSE